MSAKPPRDAAEAEYDRRQLADFLERERVRCQARRDFLFAPPGAPGAPSATHYRSGREGWHPDAGDWALAFSGGGIRSSTFCLGVLQALAAPIPTAPDLPPSFARCDGQPQGVLPLFDYVSSVSGGGFTAGFLQSLFVPNTVTPTAAQVYGQLAEEPPGRVHSWITPTPLAWLRENGRYLAPSGAGDLVYVLALSVRNWIGVQLVIGAAMMLMASILALVEVLAQSRVPDGLRSWWMPPLAVLLLWVLPVAGAYWMTRDTGAPAGGKSLSGRRGLGVTLCGLLALVALFQAWPPRFADFSAVAWPLYAGSSGVVLLLTAFWAWAAWRFGRDASTAAGLAVVLTRCFMRGLQFTGLLLALALVMMLTHWLLNLPLTYPVLTAGGMAGALAVVYRTAIRLVPLVQGVRGSRDGSRGASRRALGIGLTILALLLILGGAVFWTAITFLLVNPCAVALIGLGCMAAPAAALKNLAVIAVLAGLFVLVAGRWPSILNMSGFHYFYSARITRAYLGAANPNRTSAPSGHAPRFAHTGTAEPESGDFVAWHEYHVNPAAPIHLINITLNLTIDPKEQLVQRDRKGQPFVVLPDLGQESSKTVSVSIGDRYRQVSGAGASLGIGDWLAISGAAVSTGMGRQSSFGASVCATFANARIGRWWPGKMATDKGLAAVLPTYAYLWDELSGKFHGAHRELLYLTDGGHFENTAAYELLRRVGSGDTGVRFILMCDCGADPDYRYKDLSNLVRLVRIDFGLELEVDHSVTKPPSPLFGVFGTPETMGPATREHLDNLCALLMNVRRNGTLLARIVVIKPRLIRCASSDLLAYFRDSPAFPQEPTSDQFFDEEQWESYRKLGLECCREVLALGAPLWRIALA